MSKAKETELDQLHALIAEKISSEECSPQYLAQAIKFLKDNGVAADPEFNKDLGELSEVFNDIASLPFPIKGVSNEN